MRHGKAKVVEYLETKGGRRVAATAHEWATKLCDAAASSDIERLKELVERGAPVNQGDYDKRTALHLSASEGLQPVVRFLIEECGADPNPVDRWNGTPTDDAVRHERMEVVEYLKSKGGQMGEGKAITAHEWATKLCAAAADSDIERLKELVSKGAQVDMGDYDKRTALHLGASEGLLDIVKHLILEAKANPNPIDRWGFSPMDDAVRHRHLEVTEFLRAYGGVAMLASRDMSMDLCSAAHKGNLIGLRVLVDQGADVNLGDYDKRCAMHLAACEGHMDVLKFLVESAHATVDPVDRWGNTPLDEALRHGQTMSVEFLSRHSKSTVACERKNAGGGGVSGLDVPMHLASMDASGHGMDSSMHSVGMDTSGDGMDNSMHSVGMDSSMHSVGNGRSDRLTMSNLNVKEVSRIFMFLILIKVNPQKEPSVIVSSERRVFNVVAPARLTITPSRHHATSSSGCLPEVSNA